MFRNHDATLDGALLLKDAGLIAADTTHLELDLGVADFVKGRIIIDITACEVATGDEAYKIRFLGGETAAFSTAYELAARTFGHSSVNGNAVSTAPVGRHVIYVDNIGHTSATLDNPKPMRYVRLATDVSGDIATGINFKAYFAQDPS